MKKWWVYQKERFPLLAHGPLIFAFSLSAVSFSALLRGSESFPAWSLILVAFMTSFFSFLHLRIADEFKDFEEDSKFRSYRPVPRGLVTLKELAVIWVVTGFIQLALAIWLQPLLLIYLVVTWLYLALMSKEFFVREWLKARPVTYMWTHMLIMPLIDFYATACDWVVAGEGLPRGLFLFVIVSFFNGLVIEIGRKIRAEEDEEKGVETYTCFWGRTRAPVVWFCGMLCTAVSAIVAAWLIDLLVLVFATLTVFLLIGGGIAVRFVRNPTSRHAKPFELFSGIWTLVMYLILGAVPMALRVWT